MARSPLAHRRDVLRALGAVGAALPIAGCGYVHVGLTPPRPDVEVEFLPTPPVAELPREPAEVMALPREGIGRLEIAESVAREIVLPPRLPAGGTVGLVAPAGVVRSRRQLTDAVASLERLGFRTKVGRNVLARFGFLAGTDAERARDLMRMVRDPEVDAIVAVRGGWGCARILPLLDYDEIAAHPKPIVGYSDVTSLLLAIYARTGLVTFHGPVGVSTWEGLTAESFVRTLVDGAPLAIAPETRRNRDRTETVRGGVAEGPVLGGNLTVIAGLAGSDYLPDTTDHLLFFEEVREDAYRLDRMLVQLELAGFFRDVAGVAFGQCSSCSSSDGTSAEDVIRRHLRRVNAPSVFGAPIGHVSPVYTLPVGLPARLDADAGTLEYLRPGVA